MKSEANSNRFQETVDAIGYFKDYYSKFKTNLLPEQLSQFAQLSTDEERVKFVSDLLPKCEEFTREAFGGKSLQDAKDLKEKGNADFVRGNTEKSLESYTKAVLTVPFDMDSNSEIAVMLANRSAALYHLQKFEEALQDLDLLLTYQYPKELRYKALERKAKCLLALKRHDQALAALRNTLQALDDCKLPLEKKKKMQSDIQIMLSLLTNPKTKQGHINALVEGKKPDNVVVSAVKLPGTNNPMYPSISSKIDILEGPDVGRYAAAKTKIDVGEIVAAEPSYCSVLLVEEILSHCLICFKRLTCPYPCLGCSVAVFCGRKCQEEAMRSFHKYECGIAKALYNSGASVTVLMALRIITQKNLQYFLELKEQLKEPRENMKIYKSGDYLPVYHMVRHETSRTADDFLERTAMAVFLLRCLQDVGYFSQPVQEKGVPAIGEDEIFIGGLLLRHLQLLQFNAHEISELETDITQSIDKFSSMFLGGGVFPSLAMFNHSCDAAIVRYFQGTSVIARTVKPIEPGDSVAENYGPLYTSKEKPDRQFTLRAHYWFDCGCQACEEDWPTLAKMKRDILRFRCDAGEELRCNGIIEVPTNTSDFMMMCNICGRHTNILKGLKILQDTDAMFRQATNHTHRGNFERALQIYLEILRLLYKTLKPPFYDFNICQQAIRECMLTMGNKYIRPI